MAAGLAAPAIARGAAPTTGLGGSIYGTYWHVTLPAGADVEGLRPGLEAVLQRIDRLMSPWRKDSVLSAFNRSRTTAWQELDVELVRVADAALALRGTSRGAFDPHVGPLVRRWGFGPIAAAPPPAGAELAVGEGALCKSHPDLTLDLCGIAKGHAHDQLVETLLSADEGDFIVDLGGEIGARGRHPEGRDWRVAVEDPREGHGEAAEIVLLAGRAIATSGDKINGYTLGARRYSHIIDPRTAEPVEHGPASVSVIAGSAMLADGWATALMAAGTDGPALAERNGIDALFLFRHEGELRRTTTGRFKDHLA